MNTDRPVGALKNKHLILMPRIEFWAYTARAVGTFPTSEGLKEHQRCAMCQPQIQFGTIQITTSPKP